MSISTEIDYQLLGNCFELETYENLYKPEFMESIERKRNEIVQSADYA